MSKSYYIFRHGQTFATKANRWYWHRIYSAPILEEGKPSILRLAEYLKKIPTDFNVSSPFLRCRQTSELVTSVTGKEFSFDARISEQTFELPWAFRARVRSFVNEVEKSSHESILICTHGAVIQQLLNMLGNKNTTIKEKIMAPLPGILTIIKDGKTIEIDFIKEEIV